MAFLSVQQMLQAAREQQISLAEAVCRSDTAESGLPPEASREQMKHLWQVMQETSEQYDPKDRSNSGMVGGDAWKIREAASAGRLLGDPFLNQVIEEALKTAECNACMKRIVAAPTAGSCGVLPAVLLCVYGRVFAVPRVRQVWRRLCLLAVAVALHIAILLALPACGQLRYITTRL